MVKNLILAINPGSTSTKLAIFSGDKILEVENISHKPEELSKYKTIYDQKDMRTAVVEEWVESKINPEEIVAVVGRGGLLRPMPGGTYGVTDQMIEDLKIGYQGQHASNLGGIIAKELSLKLNVPAFIVDPVSVDEMEDVARFSGTPLINRRSLVHALNIKAVCRKVCDKINKKPEESSFVIAHLGGGISVVPMKNGRIVDCNNALEQGPFSPERAGGVPNGDMLKLCYSGEYTYDQMRKNLVGHGGLVAYLGTNDARDVDAMIENGDKKAELVLKAMAYQIAKEIGAMSTVLKGKVDRIVLTGGLAYDPYLVKWIEEMVSFIAPMEIVPGENEMLALAQGALRVINGEEKAKVYDDEVQLE